jgi:hypothetical protein
MTATPDRPKPPEDELVRLWQNDTVGTPESERIARTLMAQTWRFDQKISRRNFREYGAGIAVMAFFAGHVALGDPIFGATGIVCVAFVMAYIWWTHRDLEPLDPTADLAAYRAALLRRFDDQIRLLRTVPYWYLLPLFVPCVWVSVRVWDRKGWLALIPLAVFAAFYAFIGWLNVGPGVRGLRAARAKVEAMFTDEVDHEG